MSAHEITNRFGQRSRRFVLAVHLGTGLLGMPTGDAHPIDRAAMIPVLCDGAEVYPDRDQSQFPVESRELWKFRLTRGR